MGAMEMERSMTEWNDDRLDELNGRVKDGFASVDQRFIRLEGEMKKGFADVDKRFADVDKRFADVDKRFEQVSTRAEVSELRTDMRQLNERFDRLYYLIVVTVVGLAGSLFASNVWG
jgi:hypothetical protein